MRKRSEIRSARYEVRRVTLMLLVFIFSFLIFNCEAQTLTANAGAAASLCMGDTMKIGGNPSATGGTPPYTYAWLPVTGLDFTSISNPNAFPTVATNYTLTVTDSTGATDTNIISITIKLPPPPVSVGANQTIKAGSITTLHATGISIVQWVWSPTAGLSNANISNPVAEPGSTTTYCAAGIAANGCASFDCLIIDVIPSDTIIIYNAFSPNEDGVNDVMYFGNIQHFPANSVEVYNRYGKIIFQASPYKNDWDGKIEGTDIPCATYYVVFDPGDGSKKRNGAVTIIR